MFYSLVKKLFFIYILVLILTCCNNSKIKLVIWQDDSDAACAIVNENLADFLVKNPNIILIKEKKTKDEIIYGLKNNSNKADLIRCPSEYLEDLIATKKIISTKNFFNKQFYDLFIDKVLETAKIKNEFWGIPDNFCNHIILYYNKEFIKEAPKNTNDMIRLSIKFTNADKNQYGLVYNQYEPFFIHQWWSGFNARLIDDDGKITISSRQMINSFKFIYDLKYKYYIVPDVCDYKTAKLYFINKNAAMIIDGEWGINEYYKALGDNLGTSAIPIVSETDKKPVSWASSKCFVITKNVKNKNKIEAVKSLIEFMTSIEVQKKWIKYYRFPTIKALVNSDLLVNDSLLKGVWSSLLYSKNKPCKKNLDLINSAVRPYLEKLMSNDISVFKMVEEAQQYIDNIDNGK